MWATSSVPNPTPITPFISIAKHPPATFPTTGTRRCHRHQASSSASASASAQDIGGVGQAVLRALESGPATPNNPDSGKQKKDPKVREKEEEKEISGSDILWALQRASAHKSQVNRNKKKQQKREADKRENVNRVVDYDEARPITIKSDWATRLDDLQKRLQDFET